MKMNTDSMGKYRVSTNNRPIDLNDRSGYTHLNLAVFENEPRQNHNRYTINLSYKVPGVRHYFKMNATILNTFEPRRWLRMEDADERIRDPFYMDFIRYRKHILREYGREDILISPTAGFFHEVLSQRGYIGDTYFDSYATLHWTADEDEPIVNIRFFDWTYQSLFLEENPDWKLGSREPRWSELIYIQPNPHIRGVA